MKHVAILSAIIASTASAQSPMFVDWTDGGVYVPDILNYGPNSFPSGNHGAGTYLGRDLYMINSSPQVSWFNTNVAGITTACDAGYNIYENTGGVLEVNAVCPDGSGPASLCAFNFFQPGQPLFACIGPVAGGDPFGDQTALTGNNIQYYNASGGTDSKRWWWEVTGSSTLDVRYVNDFQTDGKTAWRLIRNGEAPAGWDFFESDGMTIELGGDGAGNVVVGASLRVNGGTAISSSVETTLSAAAPAKQGCLDTSVRLAGAVTSAECVVGAPPTVDADTTWACYVSAPETVQLRLCCLAQCCSSAVQTYSVRTIGP